MVGLRAVDLARVALGVEQSSCIPLPRPVLHDTPLMRLRPYLIPYALARFPGHSVGRRGAVVCVDGVLRGFFVGELSRAG